jgi:hypothetical protein
MRLGRALRGSCYLGPLREHGFITARPLACCRRSCRTAGAGRLSHSGVEGDGRPSVDVDQRVVGLFEFPAP